MRGSRVGAGIGLCNCILESSLTVEQSAKLGLAMVEFNKLRM